MSRCSIDPHHQCWGGAGAESVEKLVPPLRARVGYTSSQLVVGGVGIQLRRRPGCGSARIPVTAPPKRQFFQLHM
eukprot:3880026-Amphidinium_carterae.1